MGHFLFCSEISAQKSSTTKSAHAQADGGIARPEKKGRYARAS